MDGRRGRIAAALAAVFICALGAAGPARAAYTSATPPLYAQPSAGPFTWRFVPTVEGGTIAWKLSSETAWHRCTTDTEATFATLPEGRYSIEVADDVPGCSDADTDAPAAPVVRSPVTVVDGTPPAVPSPVVTVLDAHFRRVSVAATDALSGVASYTWTTGVGSSAFQSRSAVFSRSYDFGTFAGGVTVTDRAGNAASRPFTVTVARPVDVRAPNVASVSIASRVLTRRALAVRLAVDEAAAVAFTAKIRASGKTYLVPVVQRSVAPGRVMTAHIPLRREVRWAIVRALHRRRPVRATVQLVAADGVGNRTPPVTVFASLRG